MRYEVLAGDVVIGWSELETGDPPMGVASGVLHPNEFYDRALAVAGGLRVRPEGGELFEPVAGVQIEDYSRELGPEGIEVSVLGLDAEIYDRYFPMHVKAYKDRFAR